MGRVKYLILIFIISAACVALSSCSEKEKAVPVSETKIAEITATPEPEETPRYIEFAPQEL